MIIGKNHSIISNPEGVIYNGNNENMPPPSGLEYSSNDICYNNNIPSGLKILSFKERIVVFQYAINWKKP